jgi:hypothetical protein
VTDEPDKDDLRVRPDSVRSIFFTEATDGELLTWIRVAHRIVEDRLVGEGVPSDTLTEIERQLSAHYTTINDPDGGDVTLGGTSSKDSTKRGLHLDQTRYGQAAKTLDPTGMLAAAEDGTQDTADLKTF